ncbi:hypothetical protein KIN20_022741 [Parelaphostrongylus tenuis]|uniref:Ubiquitin carboxyl-terminal hydrolase 36 n=1 Tax=Parelaphostrongylus tenuis TaxID=148309 RepID=A0AAD5QVK1_PARTN|nr:hypothetical protein KIN20_022741 [Parelaphostrongylus tenuis]
MSDSLRQYDTNKIWTFEGFRQTFGVPHGAGLINGRNTCFINAVLQTLVHIPPFTRYALEIHGHSDGPHKDGCLWCVMRRTHYPNILDHSDVYFAKWVTQLWPRLFQGNYCGSQEDAHEFFLKFVGALKSVQKRNRGRAKSPSSPIDRIFGGKSRYEMICLRCGDATVKHQDFLDLSLALPQGGYGGLSPTITELLALNIENEKIELRCAKCGCKWKKLSKTITRCPPVLVLHILRFTNYATKINMAIDVERNISLRQFTYLNDEEERYELTAAIFHLGPSPDRGHYTVMTKGFNGRFYYFDDEHVTPVRETRKYTVLSTYMLFYSHTKPQKCASATDRCLDVKSTTTSSVTRLDTKTAEDGTMPVEISCEKSKDIGMNSTEGDNENRLDESSYSEISCQNLKIAESETIDLSQSINSYSSSTESKRVKQNFKHTNHGE